jgi:hypothetical protein
MLLYSAQVYRWLMRIAFCCSSVQLIVVIWSMCKWEENFLHWAAFCLSVTCLVVSAIALKIALRIYSNGSLAKWILFNSKATAVFALAAMFQSISVICLEGMEGPIPFHVSLRSTTVLFTLSYSTHLVLKACNIMELTIKVASLLCQKEKLSPEESRRLKELDQLLGHHLHLD